jgi:N-glycosylase/DNA lyase
MRTPPAFDLERVVRSHGWYDLSPWRWDPDRRVLGRPLRLGPGRVAGVEVAEAGAGSLAVRVTAGGRLARRDAEAVRRAVRACLALDEDLEPFRARALAIEGADGPRSVQRALDRGLGRLLRSPTVFEDAVKTLCTTNCSWALTRAMTARLVDLLGEAGPHGRDFPSPAAMAARPERFYRDRIRAGYRAPFLRSLAREVAAAREENLSCRADVRKQALAEQKTMLDEARRQAILTVDAAEDELKKEVEAARANLRGEMRALTDAISAKIIGRAV